MTVWSLCCFALLVIALPYPFPAPTLCIHLSATKAAIDPFPLERKLPNVPEHILKSNLASTIESSLFLSDAFEIECTHSNQGCRGWAYHAAPRNNWFRWRNDVGEVHFVGPKTKHRVYLWFINRRDHMFLENSGVRLTVKRYAPINLLQKEEIDSRIKLKIIKHDFQRARSLSLTV